MRKKVFTLMTLFAFSLAQVFGQSNPGRLSSVATEGVTSRNILTSGSSLLFVENKGQVSDQHGNPRQDIDFKIEGDGVNVFIGNGKVHYQWANEINNIAKSIDAQFNKEDAGSRMLDLYRMDVELIGANKNAKIITEAKDAFCEQYYTGKKSVLANAYKKIIYKEIYPNIDWVFYFNKEGKLEHDFVVRPGGKVSDIQFKYDGATDLRLNKDGSLTATTPMGTVNEAAPYSYVEGGRTIASSFVLKDNKLSFKTAAYRGTLVIDPTLEWGTLYGGNSDETRPYITVDKSGNIYMAFLTASASGIATTGAYKETMTYSPKQPAIVKFDSTGQRLWATYYADRNLPKDNGSFYTFKETPNICLDPYGYLYIMADSTLGKFNSSGQLIWTKGLIGFTEAKYRYGGVESDVQGNIYITGHTTSAGGANSIFATPGTYKDTVTGGDDMFLMKFDSSGQRLWGTFFGGNGSESIFGNPTTIAPDGFGNVYLAGRTQSRTGIATSGSFQDSLAGNQDAFIAKFDSRGQLLWSSYYGGEGTEIVGTMLSDPKGNVYILGETNSRTGIATSDIFKDSLSGGKDFFLVKFDSSGQRVWGSYIGGEGDETTNMNGNDMCFDVFGNIIVYGFTSSPDGISTAGAYQEDIQSGSHTLFLQKFTTNGDRIWGTYFGGTGGRQTGGWNQFYGPNSGGGSIAADPFGNIYVSNSGGREVVGQVTTPNAFKPAYSGSQHDVFLSKLKDCAVPKVSHINGDTIICSNDTLILSIDNVPGATSYEWILPTDWKGNSDTNNIAVTVNDESGSVGVVSIAACGTSDTLWQNIHVISLPVPEISVAGNVLSTGSFASYQWYLNGEPIINATDSFLVVNVNGNYKVVVSDNLGYCSQTSEEYNVNNLSVTMNNIGDLVHIYPNPTKDYVYVKSPFNVAVRIFSIEGRLLFNNELKSILEIDFSNFLEGIYLIEIRDQEQRLIKVEKLLKSLK